MFPIKMTYKPSETNKGVLVDVYSFDNIVTQEQDVPTMMVTCWIPTSKTWLTAPLWCFEPINNKILNEEVIN